jgi:uncharacterized protein YjeT (DUF2065 family)
VLSILAAGVGLWLLAEGLIITLAPETVKRLTRMISDMPVRELALAGLGAAALGAVVLWLAVGAA